MVETNNANRRNCRKKYYSKIQKLNADQSLDVLISELEQMREDHRATLDHVSQIIVAAIAGLAIVFSIATFAFNQNTHADELSGETVGGNSAAIEYVENSDLSEQGINDEKQLLEPDDSEESSVDRQKHHFLENLLNVPFYLWLEGSILFCLLFYFLTLGLERSVRYLYMRDLEDEIRKKLDKYNNPSGFKYYGWCKLSSPLITLNVHHVNTSPGKAHFSFFILAAVCLFVIVLLFVGPFLMALEDHVAILIAVGSLVALSVVFGIGVKYTNVKSREIYRDLKNAVAVANVQKGASKEQNEHEGTSSEKSRSFVSYLIYPRPKDMIKLLFILFGSLAGYALTLLLGDITILDSEYPVYFGRSVLAAFVFDYLIYQARYQLNDIRGADEDARNAFACKRGRFPHNNENKNRRIKISSTVALLRVCLAIAILLCWIFKEPIMGSFISALCALALVFGYFYEKVRQSSSKEFLKFQRNRNGKESEDKVLADLKRMSWKTFVLVPCGYVLRVAVGFTACVDPSLLGSAFTASISNAVLIVVGIAMLMAAAYPFGESFVTLTWALEASALRRKILSENANADLLHGFYKPHIAYLLLRLGARCADDYPLVYNTSFIELWNWPMLVALVLMLLLISGIALIYNQSAFMFSCLIMLISFVVVFKVVKVKSAGAANNAGAKSKYDKFLIGSLIASALSVAVSTICCIVANSLQALCLLIVLAIGMFVYSKGIEACGSNSRFLNHT